MHKRLTNDGTKKSNFLFFLVLRVLGEQDQLGTSNHIAYMATREVAEGIDPHFLHWW